MICDILALKYFYAILVFCCAIISNVSAFDLDWIKSDGTIPNDNGYFIAYDSLLKRIYVAGTVDSAIVENINATNIFLAAYDENGNKLWSQKIAVEGIEPLDYWYGEPEKLLIGSDGNIVLTGWSCRTIVIDTIKLPANSSNKGCGYSGDKFIAKFNSSGSVIWAKRLPCEGNGQCDFRDMVVVSDGIYYCATNTDTVFFESIKISEPRNGFIFKIDHKGKFIWKRSVGELGGACIFPVGDDFRLALANNGVDRKSITICKMTKEGSITDEKTFGNVEAHLTGKAIDSQGGIYFSGITRTPFTINTFQVDVPKWHNFFIVKLNKNDSVEMVIVPTYLQWKEIGMLVGKQNLLWHSSNQLVYSGSFSGAIAFDNDTLYADTNNAKKNFDGFVFVFNTDDGKVNYSEQLKGPDIDVINCIVPKGKSSMLIGGNFNTNATFMGKSITAIGKSDIFLSQVSFNSTETVFGHIQYEKDINKNSKVHFLNLEHITKQKSDFYRLDGRTGTLDRGNSAAIQPMIIKNIKTNIEK